MGTFTQSTVPQTPDLSVNDFNGNTIFSSPPEGVSSSFQKQHVIPTSVFDKINFLKTLSELEVTLDSGEKVFAYSQTDFRRNGVYLPTSTSDGVRLGVAVHNGSHPAYSNFVENILSVLQSRFSSDVNSGILNGLSKDDAIKSIAKDYYLKINKIENYLVRAIEFGGDEKSPLLWLNNADMRAASLGINVADADVAAGRAVTLDSILSSPLSEDIPKGSILDALKTGDWSELDVKSRARLIARDFIVDGFGGGGDQKAIDAIMKVLPGIIDDVAARLEPAILKYVTAAGGRPFSLTDLSKLLLKADAKEAGALGVALTNILSEKAPDLLASLKAIGPRNKGGSYLADMLEVVHTLALDESYHLNVPNVSLKEWQKQTIYGAAGAALLTALNYSLAVKAYGGTDTPEFKSWMAEQVIGVGVAVLATPAMYAIATYVPGGAVFVGALAVYGGYELFKTEMKLWSDAGYNKQFADDALAVLGGFENKLGEFASGIFHLAWNEFASASGEAAAIAQERTSSQVGALMIGTGHSVLLGSDGRDTMFHSGNGAMFGRDGDDTLLFWTKPTNRVAGASILQVDAGSGNDSVFGVGTADIDLGAGDDHLYWAGRGSVVTLGAGKDRVTLSKDILVTDATAEDSLYAYGVLKLTGGVHWSGSEDPWAYGLGHLSKYGYNKAGELVVSDILGNTTFVANGASTAYGSDPSTRAFGLYVIEMSITSRLLLDMETPWNVEASYEAILGHYMKAMTGFSGWKGVDPLVLDLDGDGVALTGQSSVSPRFDTDGDGFAEKTGWVGSHDGLLALDRNGNGLIDDVSELFGGPRAGGGTDLDGDGTISFAERMQSGFEALRTYDDNGDGKIDASDAVFSQLRVWVDANGDAITDAGELKTLDEVGIASISLASTAQAATFVSGNQVTDVGHFTRTDGTTSEIDNVALKLDNFDSVWLKQATVTTAAAALPELRGHGTLADLRQVLMVEDTRTDNLAPLHASLSASTPGLVAARGLDALRDAAAPVLRAWAAALPTTQGAGSYSSVHVVLGTGEKSRDVVDYAFSRKDAAGIEHWVLASRGDPTRADDPTSFDALVAAHSELSGRWRSLDAADFSFLERYVGENLPSVLDSGSAWSAMVATFDMALTYLDMLSVRLAVQVAPAFYGLSYDRDQDIFHPATSRQLVPFFESVFGEVKTADASTIEDRFAVMKLVFDRIISAYDRDTGSNINSYGFVYSNIVAAWENVGLPISLKMAAVDFGIPAAMIIEGGAGAVSGTAGNDLLYLGAGDQTLTGGNGHDNYIVGRNFGHDTIVDVEPFGTSQSEDYLRFAQAASTDIRADRDGIDLILTQISTGDTVRVINQFIGQLPGVMGIGNTNDDCGVTLIQFADGVTWTKEDIAWKVSHAAATSDLVMGTPDKDVLDGGAGDDTLVGGNDFDIYVFDRGYGHDTIDERVGSANFALNGIDQDAVKFGEGIGIDDVVFHRDAGSNDLVLTFTGSDDTLTIHNEFDTTYTGVFGQIWLDRIEILQFATDGQIGWNEILTRTIASQETDGNDAVFGFSAADVLDGGAGDDTLSGGNDADTYVFGYGYGHDVVDDNMGNILAADGDHLSFALGIALGDVTFSHPDFSNDLVATLSDGSSVTLHGEFDVTYTGVFGDIAFNRVEYFDFTGTDGARTEFGYKDIEHLLLSKATTSGDDRIFGFDGADTLDGGAGEDLLVGANGADTYVFGHGYGHDQIQDESSNLLAPDGDTLIMKADVTPDQVKVTRSGQFDLVLTLADTGESVTLVGQVENNALNWWPTQIETVSFADGTTWAPADLRRIALEQAITSGNDTIVGFKGRDVLVGGAGNDTLDGGEGDDTLIGGAGDDLLSGSRGDDVYRWAHGDGDDTISDGWWGGFDQVILEGVTRDAVTLNRAGSSIHVLIAESAPGAGDGGSVSFDGSQDSWGGDEVDQIVFADGSVWTIGSMRQDLLAAATTNGNDTILGFDGPSDLIMGGLGNDTLEGMGGADTLIGGAGDDFLKGGDGDDIYRWARGDGNDVISDSGWSGFDQVVLTGVTTTDVTLHRSGSTIQLVIVESAQGAGDGGSVSFSSGSDPWGSKGVEQVVFDNGTVWSWSEIYSRILQSATTSGNDTIVGFETNDTLRGGGGDDTLAGGDGDDTYIWARGDGDDTISEGMWGGIDRIVLQGVATNEVSALHVGGHVVLSIADSASGSGGSVTFDPVAESEWLHSGVEQLEFADGTVWRMPEIAALLARDASTPGNDSIVGTAANDRLAGGGGDDTLAGGDGDDTYLWARGDGNDIVSEGMWGGIDRIVLQGVSTSEVKAKLSNGHVVLTISESTSGAGDGGSMMFDPVSESEWGHPGLEQVEFADGTVWRMQEIADRVVKDAATPGNDSIVGTAANETIVGGAGDDTLAGGAGDDTYVWARGDGNDIVSEGMWGGIDRIVLQGVSTSEVTVKRLNGHVVLTIAESTPGAGNGGSMTFDPVAESEWGHPGLEQVVFADGTIWRMQQISDALSTTTGTSGNDAIIGGDGNDILVGGKGNDTLNGYSGDDTYVYALGDGNDTITEDSGKGANDRIVFSNLAPANVTLVRNGNDLVIRIAESAPGAGNSGSILVKSTLDDGSGQGIEQFTFADGTVWSQSDIRVKLLALAATTGNDTISGFNVADSISGGKGDDALNGGAGDDSYVYARGDGNDTITEDAWKGVNDRIVFTDLNPANVNLTRNGGDLIIRIAESASGVGDGGNILVKSTLEDGSQQGIEKLLFANGTVWSRVDVLSRLVDHAGTTGNDSVAGTTQADILSGGKGDDVLNGGAGNDTYVYARGDGNDTITEDWFNGNDRIVFSGLNPADVVLVRSGNDLVIRIAESASGAGDAGSIVVKGTLDDNNGKGIEQLVFAGGTTWSIADVRAKLLVQAGTAGNDTISGFNTADSIIGGEGDDVLNGGAGNDTYVYARGDGNDTITEDWFNGGADKLVLSGLNPADVVLVRSGNDLVIRIAESASGAGDAGSIVVKGTLDDNNGQGIEQLVFAGGTTWSIADVRAKLLVQAGTAGNDTISGFNTADSIIGGEGDDVLNGGAGNDTYVYARGDGNDTITEDWFNGGADKLVLSGLNPADVVLVRSGNDLVIRIAESASGAGDAGSIVVKGTLDDNNGQGIEQLVFAGGTTWSIADVRAKLLVQAGTAGNDTISGFNTADSIIGGEGDDVLNGGAGNDTYVYARGDGNDTITEDWFNGGADKLVLSGLNPADVVLVRSGNDLVIRIAESASGAGDAGSIVVKGTLDDNNGQGIEQLVFADGTAWSIADVRAKLLVQAGTAGNDTISGFNTADSITGGEGDDVLNGGGGNDTYVYARGDGNDTITEDWFNGGADKLVLSGLNPADVVLVRSGNDLVIRIAESASGAGDAGSIVVKGTLDDNNGQGIEQLVFADGTAWSIADVRAKLLVQAGTAGNDTISGFNTADSITGGEGDDVLNGGGGNDTYVYARGDGNDTITEDWFNGGADKLVLSGINPGDVTLARNGTNVTLVVAESAGAVGGSILLTRELDNSNDRGVEKIVFADSTVWSIADVRTRAVSFATMTAGDDAYVWTQGAGNEVIGGGEIGGVDRLTITGVDLAHLDLVRGGVNNADLVVSDTVSGEKITVQGQFYGSGTGIESLVVGTTTLDTAAIAEQAWYRGGSGNDGFWGSALSERFDGKGGDDTLVGGAGSDTYLYRAGDGNDSITDYGAASDTDRLVFSGLNRSDVTFSRVADDVWSAEIHVTSTGETIHIDHQFTGPEYGIEAFDFADGSLSAADVTLAAAFEGTSGSDSVYGTDASETFVGRLGDDALTGGAGNDVYRYASGDGNDTIDDTDGTADRLVFSDLTASDVRLLIVGDDLHLDVLGTGETITDTGHFTSATRGLDQIAFSDGTTWSRTDIASHAAAA